MVRWLKSLFAWRYDHDTGVWLYQVNTVTGQRAARRINLGGHQPLDWGWPDQGKGHPEVDGRPAWRSAQGQQRTAFWI